MSDPTCLGCGASVGTAGIPAVVRCGCCGKDPVARRQRHGAYCSSHCQKGSAYRTLAGRFRCHRCGAQFSDGHLDDEGRSQAPGRPRVYCSDSCRQAEERDRDLATKELAREKLNYKTLEDWDAACARAARLSDYWRGKGPTRPIDTPPEGARTALNRRLQKLQEGRSQAAAEVWQAQQREAEERRRKSWAGRLEKMAKADRAWRDKLLSGGRR